MGWQEDWEADQRTEQKYREWAAREAAKGDEDRAEHWNRVADGTRRRGEQRLEEATQSGKGSGCAPIVVALPVLLLIRWWKKQ